MALPKVRASPCSADRLASITQGAATRDISARNPHGLEPTSAHSNSNTINVIIINALLSEQRNVLDGVCYLATPLATLRHVLIGFCRWTQM
jgi:hypothetical protein